MMPISIRLMVMVKKKETKFALAYCSNINKTEHIKPTKKN